MLLEYSNVLSCDKSDNHRFQSLRPIGKAVLLGVAGMQLILRTSPSVWEQSAAPAVTWLLLDGAWVLLLGGLPALLGWPAGEAWRCAAITAGTALVGSVIGLGLHAQHGAILFRAARLAFEGAAVAGVLAATGAWLVKAPAR